MYKIKSVIVMILIFSMMSALSFISAAALIISDGDFGYELNASKHTATLVKYSGTEEAVQLPEYFRGYPVTSISRNAFSGNNTIKEIIFSNTNTTVEEYAFMNCTSLETVYIPENVVNFGDRVFADCVSLKTVTLLSNIVSVPTNMFSGCSSLENVTLNESIKEFGYGCFNGCESLKDATFVTQGVMLQPYSFNGTGFESIILSDELIAIPDYAFTNCPNLQYVTIPESVILIQPHAFDSENVTIRCFENSLAQTFAIDHAIPYELLQRFLLGDANGDAHVDISDVTAIQRHLVDLERLEGVCLLAADSNQSNSLDISDATAIQRYLAEFDDPYDIGREMTAMR